MTTDEIIAYYQSLLIMQYADLPNASATIAAFVKHVVAEQIAAQVREGFNFTASPPVGQEDGTAVGAQLDVVASYRGAPRMVYGQIVGRKFFTMPFYESDGDDAPGFALYGQSPILDSWITYAQANQPIYTLTDDELYRLTQLRARTHSSLLSVEVVDEILEDFFGNNVALFEVRPMFLTYIDLISDPDTLFGIASSTNSLPRPAGVQMSVFRSETLTEFFGFQIYGEAINPDFVGFGLYGSPQAGSFVRYP